MKYKYTVLLGILFGVVMDVLCGTVFSSILGTPDVGISLGVAFACCGCVFGYAIDKRNNGKDV